MKQLPRPVLAWVPSPVRKLLFVLELAGMGRGELRPVRLGKIGLLCLHYWFLPTSVMVVSNRDLGS